MVIRSILDFAETVLIASDHWPRYSIQNHGTRPLNASIPRPYRVCRQHFAVFATSLAIAFGALTAITATADSDGRYANAAAADCILWFADHEEGSLYDWTYDDFLYSGGGIFNTGEADVEAVASAEVARSGRFSARTTITNAFQSRNGKRAVRLMRWTDRPWDDGGVVFPASAYYSTWMYFPEKYNPNKSQPWDPGDGGWWNIFQFKSKDENDVSQPLWTMNVAQDEDTGENYVYLYTKYNSPPSRPQVGDPKTVPVGRWVHFEAFYRASRSNGRITIWQDGDRIIDADNVVTLPPGGGDGQLVFGVGNYTDHIAGGTVEGTATIYFDDAAVSRERVFGNESCGEGPLSTLRVDDVTVAEGSGEATVRVTLSPSSDLPVSVSLRTLPGSAARKDDYYGVYRVLQFDPGQTVNTVSVSIVDDGIAEDDESFTANIWAAENAVITRDTARVTISDDDVGQPILSVADIQVTEGDVARIAVRRSGPVDQGAAVSLSTRPGSALNRQDFYGRFVRLNFAAGEDTKIVLITTIDDDRAEGNESFQVRLFNESAARVLKRTAEVDIVDND